MAKIDRDVESETFNKAIKLRLVAVGGFVLLLAILSSIKIINTGEVGILLQFGEMKEVLRPGIHFVIPFISQVVPISVQTMKYEVDASAASNDLQIVNTKVALNYRVVDNNEGIKWLYQQFFGMHEERIIAPLVQEAVKANTAKYTADDLIKKRSMVKDAISATLKEKLLKYGIEVQEVSITNFDFSKEFNQAIEAKVVVEQEKMQAQLELEKKQIEVQKLVVEQNATATAQIIQANADAESAKLRAEGEANATLTNANAQQEAINKIQKVLTPSYIQYQYSGRWDGRLPIYMTDSAGFLINMPPQNQSG